MATIKAGIIWDEKGYKMTINGVYKAKYIPSIVQVIKTLVWSYKTSLKLGRTTGYNNVLIVI